MNTDKLLVEIDLPYVIEGCCNGDIKAQEKLYKCFYNYGMSVAIRYSNNSGIAGEIINDSFLKIFKGIRNFKKNGNFKAWLRKIIIYTAIDQYRKEFKNSAHGQIEYHDETIYQGHIIEKLEAEDIMQLLQSLPDMQRVIFSLYELEGFTHIEISKILEISVGTSRSCLSRAKSKLKQLIANIYELQEKAG